MLNQLLTAAPGALSNSGIVLTLEGVMLIATFVLSITNIWSNIDSKRSRRTQSEPIIQAIREEMAVMKNEMMPKGELEKRLTKLETAFTMCRTGCKRDENCK